MVNYCPQELRVMVEKPTCKQAEYKELGWRLCVWGREDGAPGKASWKKQGLAGGMQVVVSMPGVGRTVHLGRLPGPPLLQEGVLP